MKYTEEDKYEGRVFGFSLTLATMYLSKTQKTSVYELYDNGITDNRTPDEMIVEALEVARKYDSYCQSCNGQIGDDVTAICGTCLLHFDGIKEFYETRPDDYDISNPDLPWIWLN